MLHRTSYDSCDSAARNFLDQLDQVHESTTSQALLFRSQRTHIQKPYRAYCVVACVSLLGSY